MGRVAVAARRSRAGDPDAGPVETLVIEGGQHSWLYEVARYRAGVARFLASSLGGPFEAEQAAAIAAATMAERVPAAEERSSVIDTMPGGLRTLAQVALPGATRTPSLEAVPSADEPGLG
jgi:hypothetical protein